MMLVPLLLGLSIVEYYVVVRWGIIHFLIHPESDVAMRMVPFIATFAVLEVAVGTWKLLRIARRSNIDRRDTLFWISVPLSTAPIAGYISMMTVAFVTGPVLYLSVVFLAFLAVAPAVGTALPFMLAYDFLANSKNEP
jgi:hypothetical protein